MSGMWIEGAWYKDIALSLDRELDIVLRAFSSLLGYHIQVVIGNICRIAERELEQIEMTISETIKDWPLYLLHGLRTNLHLKLVELGFNDRIGVIALGNILEEMDTSFESLSKLRLYLRNNREGIMEQLEVVVPQVTFRTASSNIDYICTRNTY